VTPDFVEQAAIAEQALPAVHQIISSPLKRCYRLASFIARARQINITTDPRLTEMNFGTWEGVAWDDVPRHELDVWAADFMQGKPHGGESVADMQARVSSAIAAYQSAEQTCLMVTHLGVIRCALAHTGYTQAYEYKLPYGHVVEFRP